MINVRYNLKEEMYKYLGHIGYSIRISERKKDMLLRCCVWH